MAFDIKSTLAKIKYLSTETAFAQIVLYVLSKICTAFMEMPHDKKQLTYIPFLVSNIILLGLAIGLKFLRHRYQLIRHLLKLEMECFLLWIIGSIMMVFTWSLLDALEWGIVQIIMTILSEFLSLFMLTLLTKEQFISKMQFISYEIVLGVYIFAVSLKTVGYIKHNADSPHKDIVLLNLTTQIALMIILMDFLQKSYRRMKNIEVKDDMARLENQMVFTNKIVDSARNNGNLRETFEIKQLK